MFIINVQNKMICDVLLPNTEVAGVPVGQFATVVCIFVTIIIIEEKKTNFWMFELTFPFRDPKIRKNKNGLLWQKMGLIFETKVSIPVVEYFTLQGTPIM